MALRRLLLGISVLSVLSVNTAFSQFEFEATKANQDGILLLDALGRLFSADDENEFNAFIFKELESNSNQFDFPFPIAKDIELVANPDGSIKGAYVLDVLGGQHAITINTEEDNIMGAIQIAQQNVDSPTLPYFGWDVAKDIEIAPDWREETFGYKGYFVLDSDGVVHPVGLNNLPRYVYKDPETDEAEIVETLFPGTIDVSGSEITAEELLKGGPINYPVNRMFASEPNVKSVTPIFTYFGLGSNIARDLEISAEYVQITAPSQEFEEDEHRTIAMTNGYYILDGFGAVHSSRLPLDFDVTGVFGEDQDGMVTIEDIQHENFGKPINNTVLSPPWIEDREDLPYFGNDVAVDIEITPSGRGFYLLDVYGGVFAIGDAALSFPPKVDENGNVVPTNSIPPYFGFPAARELTLVPNQANDSLGLDENKTSTGLIVLTSFGSVHEVGLAKPFQVSQKGNNGGPITSFSDTFRALETTPIWLPGNPGLLNFEPGRISAVVNEFSVGNHDFESAIIPNFRDVTAAFSTISDSFTPVDN